ncbi:4-hydroxy-3-polyprenylbenzoate decarboxylase [Devosia enhydra]|uniref:4-hydroxy-3-polyprenylbenzoate decarboxylase n=1 Tax=Devosia enhydra TaxID=665118 RepID=A0A1K2HW05_9HYPH|nr:UbiD family decarboxylase [Devosia enhydra]SFZ83074.1 4-hydroxy-3-polyprenylbenzoate decarboxylase [Devosia enhydra]
MPYNDFREFLAVLRSKRELIDIDRHVPLTDVSKVMKHSYVLQGPALQFNDTGADHPLVSNIYSTRSKALLAFEADESTIFEKVLKGLDNPIPSVQWSGPAPCHEVIITGDDIDLTRLPVPTYSSKDGGPYITPGLVVSKDPETGVPDIGHYRFLILGKNIVSFSAQPFHRFGKNIIKCRQMGVKCEAAIVLGVDPVIAYAAQVQVHDQTDDWSVAGGLRGAPVEMVKAHSVDLEVPATAEFVIELEVDLEKNVMEGPLGEYTGYYTPASMKPLAYIKAITHRKGGLFQGLLTGKPVTENHILKQIPFEASLWRSLSKQFPTIRQIAVSPAGGVSFHMVIAMEPRFAGEARQVILAAMTSNTRPKWVIVVDPDIDVRNPNEIDWALSFRVRPAKDIIVIDNLPAGPSDPSVDLSRPRPERISSAVGVDATRPFGEPFSEVADVPGWEEFDVPELDGR